MPDYARFCTRWVCVWLFRRVRDPLNCVVTRASQSGLTLATGVLLSIIIFWDMPDGNENVIGHGLGVSSCFSFGCDFWLCPIMPDFVPDGFVFGCFGGSETR